MQGYTNAPLRYFFRLLSPDAVLWTEMEKVKDINNIFLLTGNSAAAALEKRFGSPYNQQQQRLTLQLGGNDPNTLEQCIKSLSQAGYSSGIGHAFDEINLNCGCPSIEAGGATDYGASLMKQPELTRVLIQAIHNAAAATASSQPTTTTTNDNGDNVSPRSPTTTVSLKCRTAVYETVHDMEQASSFLLSDSISPTIRRRRQEMQEQQQF
jgi:hypothetical protein